MDGPPLCRPAVLLAGAVHNHPTPQAVEIMTLFHIIDDAQIILRSRGVFYQKKLYRRGDRLYAGWGGGFIRIGSGDATSNPNVSWETMEPEFPKAPNGDPVFVKE